MRHLRKITGAALLSALSLTTLAPDPAGAVDQRAWSIDANTLRARNIQEDGLLSDGDEPYIAVISYRSRFGTPGSTTASFRGGLRELSSGADAGDSLAITDAMGRVSFPAVTRISAGDVAAGFNPEIVGTITIAMESDATPFSDMSRIFNDVARIVRTEVAGVIETTRLSDFVGAAMNPAQREALVNRFEGAVSRIESRSRLGFWDQLGVWLSSWGDPDDRIGSRMTAFMAVDESLAPLVDAGLPTVLPASRGVAGALRARDVTLSFSGDSATYDVNYRVTTP
jgi:hypothetical protein